MGTTPEAIQQVFKRRQQQHDRQLEEAAARVSELEAALQEREKEFDQQTARMMVEAAKLRNDNVELRERLQGEAKDGPRPEAARPEERQAVASLQRQFEDEKRRMREEAASASAELQAKLLAAEQRVRELSISLEVRN